MRKPRKKISQRAARRMRTELAMLRDDPLVEYTPSDFPGRYAEPKGQTRKWVRGVLAGGGRVTVRVEGPVNDPASEVFVFTAWRHP